MRCSSVIHPLLPRIRIHLLTVFAVLLFPLFALCAARRRAENGSEKKPRILLIPQLTRIGDVVCTTPTFRAVKEHNPQCFLSVLVTPKTAPILKNNPYIDDLLMFELDEYREFLGIFHFFKKVREKRFDWAINIAASAFGTLAAVYGCVPRRVKITRRGRPFAEWLTDWMNQYRLRYREGEYLPILYLNTLRFLSIPRPPAVMKEVFRTSEGDRKAEMFLRTHSISPLDIVVGISVSAGNSIKEWRVEKWGEFVQKLLKHHHVKIIFIGARGDERKIELVNAHINHTGISAAGEFSLEELPSLMKRFSIFIAADSGPIHIADALGVPLIDVVGPVDPREQAPHGPQCIVVKPPTHIKPSVFAFRPVGDADESRKAADAVTIGQVYDAFIQLFTAISRS